MARKKVNLAWISNDSTRRATFKKRKKGLIKKASELSILCDVKTSVVIFSPYDTEIEVWPSPIEAFQVLSSFKSMPEMEQSKKMVDQEGFLRQRISKAQEQLRKMERENRELEMNLLMHEAMSSQHALERINTLEDATGLALMVEIRHKIVQDGIDQIIRSLSQANGLAMQVKVPDLKIGEANLSMEASEIHGWYNPGQNMGFGGTDEMIMMMQTYGDGPYPGGQYYALN